MTETVINLDIDKSIPIRIRARVNEASVAEEIEFINDEDGSPHDISSYDFELVVQKRANSNVKLFTLTIDSGLTVVGDDLNKLRIEVTQAQATQTADTYFFRIRSVDEDHTWFNGPWEFHNGEFDSTSGRLTQ